MYQIVAFTKLVY